MQRLRISVLPAIALLLVMGFSTLIPEAAHSHAHRHGHGNEAHGAPISVEIVHTVPAVSTDHISGDHPHFNLLATLPVKPLLATAFVAQTTRWLPIVPDPGRAIALGRADPFGSIQSGHGPPPPPRAPPRI